MNSISIIVPVYNTEKQLRKCIDSILNQTFNEFELILVNDGSTDRSGIICDEYSLLDNRIKVIHQDNSGVSSARNAGLRVSKGDHFCFIDSDDWIETDFLEDGMQILSKETCDMFLAGYIYDFNDSSSKVAIDDTIFGQSSYLSEKEYIELLRNNYIASSCGIIYSKSKLVEQFKPDIHFGEDLQFVFDYLKTNPKIYASKESYYHYVYNSESAVHTIGNKKIGGVLSTYLYLFDYCKNRFPNSNIFYDFVVKRWESDYVVCLNQIRELSPYKQTKLLKQLNSNRYLKNMLHESKDKYICRYGLHPLLFVLYSVYNKSKRPEK